MKLTNVGYVAKLNKKKTKKGRERSGNDAFKPVFRDRRAGSGGGVGRVSHRWPVRMGGLSDKSAGKALAGRAQVAGYPHTDKGELL